MLRSRFDGLDVPVWMIEPVGQALAHQGELVAQWRGARGQLRDQPLPLGFEDQFLAVRCKVLGRVDVEHRSSAYA